LLTTAGSLDGFEDEELDERLFAIQEEMEEFDEMTRAEDQSVDEEFAHINSVDGSESDCQLRDGLLHEVELEDLTAFV
jgi:hypothetical protein